MQSNQLTTNIPNHLSNSIATGEQEDSDYQDDREEELYQVDGTMGIQAPTDILEDNMHVKDKERHMPQLMQFKKT